MPKAKKTRKTLKRAPGKAAGKTGTCFVIMPFGGWFDAYYDTILFPAIEKSGLTPRRADDLYRPSTIVADIWAYTKNAKLVIADLSKKNPNVFYELGLAHALAKPAILLVESMDDVPFDLRATRVLEYEKNDPNWGAILQEKIVKSIGEVLAAPALSVPPAFLETKPQRGTQAITEDQKELLSLRQDLARVQRELTKGPGRSGVPQIKEQEAEEELVQMLRNGLPASFIRAKLTERGVPPRWLECKLEEAESGTTPRLAAGGEPARRITKSMRSSAMAGTSSAGKKKRVSRGTPILRKVTKKKATKRR